MTTEAGRRPWTGWHRSLEHRQDNCPGCNAIWNEAVAAERARIADEVNAMDTYEGLIDRAAVLALIEGKTP